MRNNFFVLDSKKMACLISFNNIRYNQSLCHKKDSNTIVVRSAEKLQIRIIYKSWKTIQNINTNCRPRDLMMLNLKTQLKCFKVHNPVSNLLLLKICSKKWLKMVKQNIQDEDLEETLWETRSWTPAGYAKSASSNHSSPGMLSV